MVAPLLALALLAGSPAGAVSEADVRPVFESGPLSPAAAAIRSGRPPEVASALEGRAEPEARFLRSRALVQLGRGPEAEALLAGVAAAFPDVADRVNALAAQAAELSGRPADAEAAWTRIPEDSVLWPEARLSLARLEIAARRPEEAVASLKRLLEQAAPSDLSRPDPGSRALLLAASAVAGADPAAARRFLVECFSRHPLAPEARQCREGLEALPAPERGPPGDEEALRRAEALLEWNRNEMALAEAERLAARLAPGTPQACRAEFVRGKALRKLRQYARSADVLVRVEEHCSERGLQAKSLYLLAVARANLDSKEGIATYLHFAREFPDQPQAGDALFFAADLLAREGNLAGARRSLADLLARYPHWESRPEALFRSAWLARRQGQVEAAIAGLKRIEEEYRDVDPYEHARAAYWRGRWLDARGGRKGARAIWSDLVARYPADYYGLLARARLDERGDPQAEYRVAAAPGGEGFRYRPGPMADDRHFRAGLLLLRLGMPREAADELNAVDRRTIGPGGPDGAEPLLLLAELLDRAGDPRSAHGLLRSQGRQVLRQPPAGLGLRVWQVAYPPAWREDVLRSSKAASVPPDLVQAIVREESALDPSVVSPAGAVGLTQLMLPTAERAARRIGLPAPTRAELGDPSLNIRLGAIHVGDLLRRFGGSATLAIAAYNAGETAARGWWRSRGALPVDEFVEEIPIQETRGYVKRVLRTYAAYRMLYGRAGEEPVRLPQRLPSPPAEPLHADSRAR